MEKNTWESSNREGNPGKVYREESEGKGNMFSDTPAEADARDRAKVEKSLAGESQKIDSVDPDELNDDDADEMLRETLDNK